MEQTGGPRRETRGPGSSTPLFKQVLAGIIVAAFTWAIIVPNFSGDREQSDTEQPTELEEDGPTQPDPPVGQHPEETLPPIDSNHESDTTSASSNEGEHRCAPLASIWAAGVADELDISLVRTGLQIASLQRAALPSLPQVNTSVGAFSRLTYAGSDWIIRFVVDCSESVVAYSVTTAAPDTFSPSLPPCVGIEGGLGSLKLPALHQRDLIWVHGGGANVPPSYAEIRRLGRAEGCGGSIAFMLGSVIAADLAFDRWLSYDSDVAGYEMAPGTDERLLLRVSDGDATPYMCARASTFGEYGIHPEEIPVSWLVPFFEDVWHLTGGGIPENYGEELC
jgi:hypothetical protein